MGSPVDICNLSLALVGVKPIASLTDAVEAAQVCAAAYPHARDSVLEDWDWSFASTRVQLAADATAPAWGFDYRYLVPSDALNLREVSDSSGTHVDPWRSESGYVLCNVAAPLNLRYTKRVEDSSLFSHGFEDAIILQLASDLAIPLAGNRELRDDLLKQYAAQVNLSIASEFNRRSRRSVPTPFVSPVNPTTGQTVDSQGQPLYVPDSIAAR